MKQAELTFCANRAQVLTTQIRRAKSVTNAQQPAVVEEAIQVAQDIVDRLRAQLPNGPNPRHVPAKGR